MMSEKWPYQHYLRTVALQEIHRYQKTTELLIWRLPFACLVWELSQDYHPRNATTVLQLAGFNLWGATGGKQICAGWTAGGWQPLCNPHKAYYNTAQGSTFVSAIAKKTIEPVKD